MEYEKFHILDVVIEDETQRNGRDVTVSVDTHEMVTIELGNTVTVRTNEAGVDDLQAALNLALVKLEEIRYEKVIDQARLAKAEQVSEKLGEMTQEAPEIKSSERSEVQQHDLWNANDPVNW